MSGILTAVSYMMKELVFLVSYVKNNAFPQPLSASEERKYLKRMAEGDADARNILIEHNLRLVAHIVKKFENTGEDTEDLISIGTIGLIKAIRRPYLDRNNWPHQSNRELFGREGDKTCHLCSKVYRKRNPHAFKSFKENKKRCFAA